jgi:hypothetical protein
MFRAFRFPKLLGRSGRGVAITGLVSSRDRRPGRATLDTSFPTKIGPTRSGRSCA